MKAEVLILLLISVLFYMRPCIATSQVSKPTLTWAISAQDNLPERATRKLMNEKNPVFLLLQKHLPEYRHEMFFGTTQRIEHELKISPSTCYPASTDRDRRIQFSYLTPVFLNPLPVVITRKDIARKYKTKNGTISLSKLIEDKNLQGLFIKARSYGEEIDNIVSRKYPESKRESLIPFGWSGFQMVQNRRVDFTLEYGYIVDVLKTTRRFGRNLVALPIEDTQKPLVSYIACSRTPEGLEAIKKLDQIIRQHITDMVYKEALMRMAPEKSRNIYEHEVDRFIELRSRTSVIL